MAQLPYGYGHGSLILAKCSLLRLSRHARQLAPALQGAGLHDGRLLPPPGGLLHVVLRQHRHAHGGTEREPHTKPQRKPEHLAERQPVAEPERESFGQSVALAQREPFGQPDARAQREPVAESIVEPIGIALRKSEPEPDAVPQCGLLQQRRAGPGVRDRRGLRRPVPRPQQVHVPRVLPGGRGLRGHARVPRVLFSLRHARAHVEPLGADARADREPHGGAHDAARVRGKPPVRGAAVQLPPRGRPVLVRRRSAEHLFFAQRIFRRSSRPCSHRRSLGIPF